MKTGVAIRILKERRQATAKEVARLGAVSVGDAQKALKALEDRGLATWRVKWVARGVPPRIWRLTLKGHDVYL